MPLASKYCFSREHTTEPILTLSRTVDIDTDSAREPSPAQRGELRALFIFCCMGAVLEDHTMQQACSS